MNEFSRIPKVFGLGGIGYQIARRCAAFDMNIVYHKRTPLADNPDNLNLTYVSLDQLLQQSDFVVCICPLTEETNGLIGKEEFAKMKNSAVLINSRWSWFEGASVGFFILKMLLYRLY